jgi:hypothetical protein
MMTTAPEESLITRHPDCEPETLTRTDTALLARFQTRMPSSSRGANTLIKRHLWLLVVIALFLIKGKAAKAQEAGAIDFDQECGM